MRFEETTFDHAAAGFVLTGKHTSIPCARCHTPKNIKDADVQKILSAFPHRTFLGLASTCVSCHQDRHRGTLGTQCQSCHSTQAWLPVTTFDHTTTRFALTGQHASVACARCHTELISRKKDQPLVFSTKPFDDCKPCHTSPHRQRLTALKCQSCHSTVGWMTALSQPFDHTRTAFPLVGKHATVSCQQCHSLAGHAPFAQAFLLPHETCMSCHRDYHRGQFAKTSANDCTRCHTERVFKPSTFTFEHHKRTRFPLTGAHGAVPCSQCHQGRNGVEAEFQFASLKCEACHQDQHRGQFASVMTELSCAMCHSTLEWNIQAFNHAQTRFPLVGKHTAVPCVQCHKERLVGGVKVMQYQGIPGDCQACHPDVHADQFAKEGRTACSACHTPNDWHTLIFQHDTQSAFPLTGAHKTTDCRGCHREERLSGRVVVRYKPLSTKCESCHQQEKGT